MKDRDNGVSIFLCVMIFVKENTMIYILNLYLIWNIKKERKVREENGIVNI